MQYLAASGEYLKAATTYPVDDENHTCKFFFFFKIAKELRMGLCLTCSGFLHCAYHAQFDGGSTPKYLIFLLDRLKESMAMAKDIWALSLAGRKEKALEADLKARDQFRRALDNKQMELDSFVVDPNPGMEL